MANRLQLSIALMRIHWLSLTQLAEVIVPIAAMLLCSCAQTPRIAPRFVAPSTAPLAVSHKQATTHVEAAKEKAKQLETEVAPELKLQVAALEVDLDNALGDLNTSEGQRQQLDTQLAQEADRSNKLADNYDKAAVKITNLEVSRHKYVKLLFYAVGALALAGAWIFRKPLLMLAGGI